MLGDTVRRHLRPTSRSSRSPLLHPRQLACLLTVFLLFGQQDALWHALSHWNEFGETTGVAFDAAVMAKPVSVGRSQSAQEYAVCLQCAAYAALMAVLPVLVVLRLAHARRWHFLHIGFHVDALVFPVAVYSRDPSARLQFLPCPSARALQ